MTDGELTVEIFEIAIPNADERQHGIGRYGWRIQLGDEEIASSFTNYDTPEDAAGVVVWLRANAFRLPVPELPPET